MTTKVGRALFLLFAVFATVATSPARWHVAATPVERPTLLAPNASATQKISYEASAGVEIVSQIDSVTGRHGKLRFEHVGARDCASDMTLEQDDDEVWRVVQPPGNAVRMRTPLTVAACEAPTGTAIVRVTNIGSAPISFHWRVIVRIEGRGSQPDGAFVRATIVE